jgi:hypothetical protein
VGGRKDMRKTILKIGLVFIVAFMVSGIDYVLENPLKLDTKTATIAVNGTSVMPIAEEENNIPEFHAILIAPCMEKDVWWEPQFDLLERVLISGGWNDIIKLYEYDATRDNIINCTRNLSDNPWDTTLVVIGSHGVYNTSSGWQFQVKGSVGMMTGEDLNENGLNYLNSSGICVLIEACESSTGVDVLRKDGRIIWTSTSTALITNFAMALDEFADYTAYGNKDGAVSVEETYRHIYKYEETTAAHFQDDYPCTENNESELSITFQNWNEGRIDQLNGICCSTNCQYEFVNQWWSESQGVNLTNRTAQKFYPSLQYDKLTKVRTSLNTTPLPPQYNLLVSIRKGQLESDDLGFKQISANDIVDNGHYGEKYTTIKFNPSIDITKNMSIIPYFIVYSPTGTDNPYSKYKVRTFLNGSSYPYGSPYHCYYANGTNGTWIEDSDQDIRFVTYGKNSTNMPPYVPKRPGGGPNHGIPNKFYSYYVTTTDYDNKDNKKDNITYYINWSDGPPDEYGKLPSGWILNVSHSWESSGIKLIRVKAKDEHGGISNYSDVYLVNITHTPNAPTINGSLNGTVGVKYNYTFVSTDPDGDNLFYYIKWGDDTNTSWLGPYLSGEEIIVNHTWSEKGKYTIQAKAKDIWGAESGWGYLDVTMPNLFGNTQSGSFSQDIKNKITGSIFTMEANGTADSISVYIQTNPSTSPETKCMIYRFDNSELIGTTEEKILNTGDDGAWVTFNFSDPKPTLVRDTEYVLVGWSNDTCNFFYDNATGEQAWYCNDTYNTSAANPISWTSNESKNYSIFCRYTTKPEITNVCAAPNTVGSGFNITISADIEDNECGIDNVTVNITYPNNVTANFTMNNTGNDTCEYVFCDTWVVGQYNYTICAVDELGDTNTSSGHSFNVSAQATIGIATLKDTYGDNEYINLTDPPTPPSDYSLIGRGLTWDKYYNAITGKNILEVSAGPINYQDEDNEWNPIECTLNLLSSNHPAYQYGYRAGNDHGLYNVYFKPNAQNSWPVAFAYNKSEDPTTHIIRSKLVGVGYLDPASNWAYKYLQQVTSSQGQIDGSSAVYEDVFTGTDVTWSYGNTELKEAITMSNTTKTLLQSHPPSEYGLNDESSYLVFITKLDHQNLNMYNASGMLSGNVTISDEKIDFKDALGYFRCALPIGDAYELNNESARQKLTYRIIQYNGNTYLLSGLKVSDLNTMTFPVIIDPTLTVESLSSDGYIYNSNIIYNTAWSASTGTISSSAYYITIGQKKVLPGPNYYVYRGLLLFNTSSLPSNVLIDNATLSLYKMDDYSTTDFTITVQNGQPTYPHNPLQTADYSKSHYSGNGGGLNTAYFVNGRNNISLTNLSWITKGGTTKLCLRSSRDISGTTPTGNEYVNVCSCEHPQANHAPKLVIEYRNQSKINNTGSTNISGYLLIQVQYYNEPSKMWVVADDTVNESSPRTILWDDPTGPDPAGQNILALDTIFNGLVNTQDLSGFGNGTYRVYAAFRDPNGDILQCDDETYLVAWYEFEVTF